MHIFFIFLHIYVYVHNNNYYNIMLRTDRLYASFTFTSSVSYHRNIIVIHDQWGLLSFFGLYVSMCVVWCTVECTSNWRDSSDLLVFHS